MRVETESLQVGLGLQEIRQPPAAGEGPDRLASLAQGFDEGAGPVAEGSSDGARAGAGPGRRR